MLNLNQIYDCNAVLIAGPTAAGKSKLANRIAEAKDGIIINADSMQVYSRWRVLTARPSREEESQFAHAMYGHVNTYEDYSVGHWLKDVSKTINFHKKLPIITGGTGLYFTALTTGLVEIPKVNPETRLRAKKLLNAVGIRKFASIVEQLDPDSFEKIDPHNPARLIRIWEVITSTGKGLKAWQEETQPPLFKISETYPILINSDPYRNSIRIVSRLNKMVKSGALEECAAAIPTWDISLPSSKAIGAEEFIDYLQGNSTLSNALDKAFIATRQFAKRQRTWFRSRMKMWHHIYED